MTEKEYFAVLFAIEKLRPYIERSKFTVIIAAAPIIIIALIGCFLFGGIVRWINDKPPPETQFCNFDILDRKGRDHVVPDACACAWSLSVQVIDAFDIISQAPIDPEIAGVWLEPKTSKNIKRTRFIIWDAMVFVLAVAFFICEILMVKRIQTEPKKLFKHLAMLVTHIVGFLKFLFIITHQNELAKIRDMLQDENLNYTSCTNCINIPKAAKSFSNKICLATYLLDCMVGMSAHLSALRNLNAAIKENQFGGNVTCYDFLPFLYVIPFESETTNGCKNALITMDLGLCLFAGYIASHDTMMYSIIICLTTKLEVLTEATRNIRGRIIQKLNLPEDFEAIRDDNLPELEEELHRELKLCNRNLELLLSASRCIEGVFSYTNLAQALMSLLVIASCLFATSLMTYSDPELYSLVEYTIACVFELLMVCLFGNSITVASETYRYSLYEIDWHSSSKRFKQCLLIMMYRMERPLYLTIGKFSPLTLHTFVAVMKGSFSYATVFKTVD